jgi:SAM-dependent methyltransferase
MENNSSSEPISGSTTQSKQSSKWKLRIKRFLNDPPEFSYRVLSTLSWKLYRAPLNLFCDILFRWGEKLGVTGNFRARMYWKAGRRDIVPVPQLYDYMSQDRPFGQFYSTAPKWSSRSQTILNVVSSLITHEDSILEIGCNLGRNLNHLWQAGYRNLSGMEISEYAVNRLRKEYPCLAATPVDIGPAERSIQNYCSDSVDLIFTMAVLEHLHPDNKRLFGDIARVARKYVLAIEPRQGRRSHMQYPWDIKNEFTAVGLTCIDQKAWWVLWPGELTSENEWQEDMDPYDAFLFKVSPA